MDMSARHDGVQMSNSHQMSSMDMKGMDTGGMAKADQAVATVNASGVDPDALKGQPFVESLAMMPVSRQQEAAQDWTTMAAGPCATASFARSNRPLICWSRRAISNFT
jgi:hypothetical protein